MSEPRPHLGPRARAGLERGILSFLHGRYPDERFVLVRKDDADAIPDGTTPASDRDGGEHAAA